MSHKTYSSAVKRTRVARTRKALKTPTPQSKPIPSRKEDMAKNNAGGFSFKTTPWQYLDRFLILGSTGGTYYTSERKLTQAAAQNIIDLVKTNGAEVVARIVEVSAAGRAPKNDPALFALALVMAHGDDAGKTAAYAAISKVARIGTHILHLASYVHEMRGWGRGLRNAFASWYTTQAPKSLALNLVKYANRDGWTHRDILRLSHPKAAGVYQELLAYAADKPYDFTGTEVQDFMDAVSSVKLTDDADLAAILVESNNLPREVVPTQLLNETVVWDALLPHMGLTAMLRNLGTMTKLGVLAQGNSNTQLVLDKMRDEAQIKKAKLHPIAVLSALTTYRSGQGYRGSATWTPVMSIVDELDELFYRSFGFVESTGKRLVVALDVSGSMGCGEIAGVPGLTPRAASAALAMLFARTEKNVHFIAFTSAYQSANGITVLSISSKDRLDDVVARISNLPFGGTDCALPMIWAGKQKIEADAFIVMTDNETWAGQMHPSQALVKYRKDFNIPAKLVVIGMTATDFSIADPKDAGMLDVVGFDTAAPNVISDFIKE